jgi:hypothetical protein
MLIDCCPPGTRRAAVDLDFKRRRSKRGSIAGEDQSSLVAWERPVLLLRPPFLSPVGKSLSVARSRASHLRVEAWHHLLLYISTPAIPSWHRRPNVLLRREIANLSSHQPLSHSHARTARCYTRDTDHTLPSFRLSSLFPRSTRPFGHALRKYIPECPLPFRPSNSRLSPKLLRIAFLA